MASEEHSSDAPKVDFYLIKSNHFRVVHVDGAFGGITAQGNIYASIYSERGALPTKLSHVVLPDGNLGQEVSRESKSGFVREVEVGLILSIPAAKAVCTWLQGRIDEAEAVIRLANVQPSTGGH